MSRAIRGLALLCGALASCTAWALPDDATVRSLLVERIAQKRGIGFAVVLLDSKGTRILTAGGLRKDGPAIAADTEFEIGSITKTFTSLLLADLVVRGEAKLDDPATKYLPEARGLTRDGKAVSLEQLATHTSGLPRVPKNLAPANPADPYADYDAAKLTGYLAGDVLERVPGTKYEYSNLGGGLLGYAGLAWHILTRDGRTILWHNGQTGGFASMMAFDPQAREGVIVLSNASISVDDLALHMLDKSIALWAPPKDRTVAKVDAKTLDRITGRYDFDRILVVTVRRDGDRVFAQATSRAEYEIFPESDYEYFYKAVDAQLSFTRDGDRVSGFVLHQGGRNLTARRID